MYCMEPDFVALHPTGDLRLTILDFRLAKNVRSPFAGYSPLSVVRSRYYRNYQLIVRVLHNDDGPLTTGHGPSPCYYLQPPPAAD